MKRSEPHSSSPLILLIGLGMVLIALLSAVAVAVAARRQGISVDDLADFQRLRAKIAGGDPPSGPAEVEPDEKSA